MCFAMFNVCFKSILDAQASNFGKILDSENFEILNLKSIKNNLSGNASDLWHYTHR